MFSHVESGGCDSPLSGVVKSFVGGVSIDPTKWCFNLLYSMVVGHWTCFWMELMGVSERMDEVWIALYGLAKNTHVHQTGPTFQWSCITI